MMAMCTCPAESQPVAAVATTTRLKIICRLFNHFDWLPPRHRALEMTYALRVRNVGVAVVRQPQVSRSEGAPNLYLTWMC
jgi:hypothetical protein